jgi:hypothetical protein
MHRRLVFVCVGMAACVSAGPGARSNPEPRRPLLSLSAEERRSVAAAIEEVIAVLPPDTAVVCVTLAGPVRPPGYVDPHLVTLRAQRLVGTDSAVANLDVYQGARIRIYRCHSHRDSDGGWRAQCTKTGEAISALPSNEAPQLSL